MARYGLIIAAGLAIAYGISLLPLDQINVVGQVWGATLKVFDCAVLGAALVRALTGKRQ